MMFLEVWDDTVPMTYVLLWAGLLSNALFLGIFASKFNLSHQILSRHAALVYFNGFWILFYSWYWYFVSSLSFFLISLVSILSILSLIIFSSGFLIICIYILSFANFCSFIILLDLIGSYFPAFLAEPPKTD